MYLPHQFPERFSVPAEKLPSLVSFEREEIKHGIHHLFEGTAF